MTSRPAWSTQRGQPGPCRREDLKKEKETSELFLGAQTLLLYSDLRFSGYVFGYFVYFFVVVVFKVFASEVFWFLIGLFPALFS